MDRQGIVTVIIPIYNTAQYLSRCIESIMQQTYDNIELILVDDGSTDCSLEICHEYMKKDNRIKVIHKDNGGVCSARNRGLGVMHGDYFMFVDSDDAIEKNIIKDSITCFEQNPYIDMVVFGWEKIFTSGCTDSYLPKKECIKDMEMAIKILLHNYNGYGGGYPNKIWKTSSFQGNIPKYNESLYYFEDIEWMTRMFSVIHSFACIPQNGYLYYIRNDSATFKCDKEEKREFGYHMSALQIVENLSIYPGLYKWYRERYYPEIVNGVINSWQKKYFSLRKWLLCQMRKVSRVILTSNTISIKIKIRCIILCLLSWVR